MTTAAQMRLERIERLINELTYEITRGVMEREIEPDLEYTRVMPLQGHPSQHDAALLTLYLRPYDRRYAVGLPPRKPRLRVIEGQES
jgi:hypothetical protein